MLPKRQLNRLAAKLSERRAQEFGIEATIHPHGGRSFDVRYMPGTVTTRDVLEEGGLTRVQFTSGRIPKADLPRNTDLEPGWCMEIHRHVEGDSETGSKKLEIDQVSEHPLDPEIWVGLVERR